MEVFFTTLALLDDHIFVTFLIVLIFFIRSPQPPAKNADMWMVALVRDVGSSGVSVERGGAQCLGQFHCLHAFGELSTNMCAYLSGSHMRSQFLWHPPGPDL